MEESTPVAFVPRLPPSVLRPQHPAFKSLAATLPSMFKTPP
jgi:serine/threonine protein kinase